MRFYILAILLIGFASSSTMAIDPAKKAINVSNMYVATKAEGNFLVIEGSTLLPAPVEAGTFCMEGDFFYNGLKYTNISPEYDWTVGGHHTWRITLALPEDCDGVWDITLTAWCNDQVWATESTTYTIE